MSKIALVTGGLSGIGKGTIFELAKRHYKIIIFDHNDNKAPQVIQQAINYGAKDAVYHKVDLLSSKEITAGFDYIKSEYGKLDCAFNNAGTGILAKPFDEVTEEEMDKLWNLDVKAYMLCMQAEIRLMKTNNFGRIVNTASGSGLVAAKGSALYTAVKHAVVGLTKAAALDYATQNITINAVAPGTIETELIQQYKNTPDYEKWCKSNPAGRLGKPSEIGRVVAFLFEEDSAFINGVVLPIDSGFCAGRY
ncbi:SDR family NAD(P)-dependent oxidoreductase [Limosilactobacillus reuteri]|uniref:SDR family NAD(P)-dependent oxidoreductase n=1 Tax=Limosilactobacillus reuteri TaxID=1598 RepID=UPI003D781A36